MKTNGDRRWKCPLYLLKKVGTKRLGPNWIEEEVGESARKILWQAKWRTSNSAASSKLKRAANSLTFCPSPMIPLKAASSSSAVRGASSGTTKRGCEHWSWVVGAGPNIQRTIGNCSARKPASSPALFIGYITSQGI